MIDTVIADSSIAVLTQEHQLAQNENDVIATDGCNKNEGNDEEGRNSNVFRAPPGSLVSTDDNLLPVNDEEEDNTGEQNPVEVPLCKTQHDILPLKIDADNRTVSTTATSSFMFDLPCNQVSSDETTTPQQSLFITSSSTEEEDRNEEKKSVDSGLGGEKDESQSIEDNSVHQNDQIAMQEVPVTPMSSVCPWSVDPAYDYDNLPKMEIIPDEPVDLKELQIGDHVYQWRSWIGIPGVFQHHGIVLDIQQVPVDDEEDEEVNNENNEDENDQDDFDDAQKTDIVEAAIASPKRKPKRTVTQLTIADFSNIRKLRKGVTKRQDRETDDVSSTSSKEKTNDALVVVDEHTSLFSLKQRGNLRVFQTTETHTWYKVHYEAPFWKRQVCRSGTCTSAKSNPAGLVLARVHFIVDHPEVLPDYHVLYANCECVAVWCKTGHWSTLQASSFLEYTAAGQAKSAATMATAAAHTQVTVPATGVWGWLGYTTKVSLMTAQPLVVPALASYGIVTVGAPALLYQAARSQWKKTTAELHAAFWEAAMESPEKFSENMAEWSQHV